MVKTVQPGHTLLEMLLSLVLLSVVMTSVGSAVMFASQAIPDEQDTVGSLLSDCGVLSRIAADLSGAQYVIEQSEHTVAVVVPDRTGDAIPDRVRYAWSGVQGEPLLYQLNDEKASVVIDAVAAFNLSYSQVASNQMLPAALALAEEAAVAVYDQITSGSDVYVQAARWHGQALAPVLSSGAVGFIPTQVQLYAGRRGATDGQVSVALRDRSGMVPGNVSYATANFSESSLGATTGWASLPLGVDEMIVAGEPLALTATYVSGSGDAMLLRSDDAGSNALETTDSGATWSGHTGYGLLYRLLGREVQQADVAYQGDRQHIDVVNVTLQRVAEGRSPLQRRVRLMLAPPKLDGFGQADFEVSPVGMDLNADGEADWVHSAGVFPAASLRDGVWAVNGELVYKHASLSDASLIRVRARMRSNDTLGPTIYGPYTVNSLKQALPVAVTLRSDGDGGQELVVYNDLKLETEALVLSGLPSGFVDIQLVVLPGQDLASFAVNHQMITSLSLRRVADSEASEPAVRLGGRGGVAEFESVSIEVGGGASIRESEQDAFTIKVGRIGIGLR